MRKPEFVRAVFPIIPVTSKFSLWLGVSVNSPASLSLILAVSVIHFILFNNTHDLTKKNKNCTHKVLCIKDLKRFAVPTSLRIWVQMAVCWNMFLIVYFLTFYNTYSFVNGHDEFQTVRDNLANIQHKILVAYHSSTFLLLVQVICKSRWSRGIKPGLTAVRMLGWRFRIPLESWKYVSCECCVVSGRGLCVGLIARPVESYRMWRV